MDDRLVGHVHEDIGGRHPAVITVRNSEYAVVGSVSETLIWRNSRDDRLSQGRALELVLLAELISLIHDQVWRRPIRGGRLSLNFWRPNERDRVCRTGIC